VRRDGEGEAQRWARQLRLEAAIKRAGFRDDFTTPAGMLLEALDAQTDADVVDGALRGLVSDLHTLRVATEKGLEKGEIEPGEVGAALLRLEIRIGVIRKMHEAIVGELCRELCDLAAESKP
jgi:hypothetical protein